MTDHTTTDRQHRPADTTMADVSHTNPHTGESMGQVFEHGVTVVADGGRDPAREDDPERGGEPFDADPDDDEVSEPSEVTDEDESADDRDVMADVRHETKDDAANRVFERGGEHGDRED